tara:strand:+ start:1103 stop:1354 length:252 start_codon:yes stop_codon:yes gene_type:complete
MSLFFLILGVATADVNPAMHLIKIPITQGVKKITCEQAYKNNVTWKLNPNYEPGNGQIWGYHTHKDLPVYLYYCKDKKGNWVR